jgi:putative heme-binding domain-containing protein
MKRLVLITALGIATVAQGQLANQPPLPQWLGSPDAEGAFETTFTHQGKLLKAILFAAGDGEIDVTVNGEAAGHVKPESAAVTIDLTRNVRGGANVLQLRSRRGRVAALLELNGDLANKTWLGTDGRWRAVAGSLNAAPMDAKANPFDFTKSFDAYNSWQLAKPGAQNQATDAATLTVPPGFKAELIRSSSGDEGSWIALAFDPEGRVTLAREKRGLLRFDPATRKMEVIEDTLLECRGLLYAGGALFANANTSRGLFRLRDADGDGRFEEAREILHTDGDLGHGRNHVKMGPDGWLWVAQGNNVLMPRSGVSSASPLQNYAPDQVLPNPWDGSMFDGNVELPAGRVLRVKPDGSETQLFAGGFRNPLDLAFSRDGELFTFDADMERDVGASWYMPTRVLHVVPGADYGWRRGTGRQPAWYADTLPSVLDIGLASPTGVFFGYGARFPAKYQEALFCLDWAYGRILAVTLQPRGASHCGTQETFVSGRPLNVTDGCIGPDGAMWFITGGRGTQSGLYRVTWLGDADSPVAARGLTPDQQRRRLLEQGRASREEVTSALGSEDPFLRHAAITVLEQHLDQLPVALVNEQAGGWLALSRWLVAVRSGNTALRDAGLAMALHMPWENAPPEQKLAALRVVGIGVARSGSMSERMARESLAVLEPRLPANDQRLNWELCRLLVSLKSPTVIAKSVALLRNATASEDLLFYPLHLRYLKEGWTLEQRRIVFEALNRAEKLNGASTYFKAIADTRSELAAALAPAEAKELAGVISSGHPAQLAPHALPGHTFKQWKLADLAPLLDQVSRGRNFEKAKAALVSAQCVFCHRVGNDPSLPAGVFGPDLSQVSARFGRRDLLTHILEPSLVIDEKYRSTVVTRTDGQQVTGFLEREDDERVVLKPNPLVPDVVEVAKAQIRERKLSEVSPMPAGALNALKADQILDLLAWFETGGDPKKEAWARQP